MSKDRNQRAREEFLAAQGRRQSQMGMAQLDADRAAFALDFAAGKVGIYDRNGQRLEVGNLVLHAPPPGFTYWQVVGITPNMAPNIPPGVVTVTLQATVPLHYRPNQPCGDLLVIGKVTGAGAVAPTDEVPAGSEEAADSAPNPGDEPVQDALPDALPTPPVSTEAVDLDAAQDVPAGPRMVELTDGD